MVVDGRRQRSPGAGCLAWLALSLPVLAQGDPGPPLRLAIEPNAILRGEPLVVEVEGIRKDRRARIWIVEDCDEDGRPDEGEDCPPLFEATSEPADRHGVARHFLDFPALEVSLPRGETLWLRAAKPGSERFLQARFGFVGDECSIFATVVDVFLRRGCQPGLPQVLRRHREASDLAKTVFEVRRIATGDPSAEPARLAGSRGASGVAWLDRKTLLVTAAGPGGEGALAAGVYRWPLAEGAEPEILWRPAAGEPGPVAPLALAGGRVAFARQAPGPQQPGGERDVAWLTVLGKDRAVEREVALPYKVHQLVAASADGRSVLALSLGAGDNQPVFLAVSLEPGGPEPEVVGFSNALYQSLMREPGGEASVVAFENTFSDHGWQLVLAEGETLTHDLMKRDGSHDLAPAWRPKGGELAYLAQVGVMR